MRVLTGAMVLISFAVPAMAQRTVVCSSSGNGRRTCPADTRNGVVLLRERSDGVCQQGSTWGYNSRGIYVSGGCSAEFQVGSSGNNGGNANGYGNNNGNDNDSQNRNQNGYGNNGNNSNGYGNNNNGNGYGNGDRQRNNGSGQNGGGSYNSYGNGQQRGGVIPAGTRMDVKLEQAVSPSSAKQGDIIPGRLVNDVEVNGSTVASAGAQVQLRVTSVQGGNSGSLSLQLASMSVNGRDYRLSSNSIHSVRDSQTSRDTNNNNSDGGGNVLGSVLGAIASARQTGELPSGTVYTFRLTTSARTGSTSNRNNQ